MGLLLLINTACSFPLWNPSTTRPAGAAESLSARAAAAEQKWQALDIRNYHLRISEVRQESIQTYEISVLANQPIEHSAACSPTPAETSCQVRAYSPEDFTVPALFEKTRRAARLSLPESYLQQVTFDPTYGFPRLLYSADPQDPGALSVLSVLDFQVFAPSQGTALPSMPTPAPRGTLDATTLSSLVNVIQQGGSSGSLWASNIISGSFTRQGAEERLALVGGIPSSGDLLTCWVIISFSGGNWAVQAVSKPISYGSDTPPDWPAPWLTDFNKDGLLEAWLPYITLDHGWRKETRALYLWNGSRLLEKQFVFPILDDNTRVTRGNDSKIYRHSYQSRWTWEDQNQDGMKELVLQEEVVFYPLDSSGKGADTSEIIARRQREQVYQWNGSSFQPSQGSTNPGKLPYPLNFTLYPWWDPAGLPALVFDEPVGENHRLHFTTPDGREAVFDLEKADRYLDFYARNGIVYYRFTLTGPSGELDITPPDLPGTAVVFPSPDGSSLAWLVSDNRLADRGKLDYSLVITGPGGQNSRLAWQKHLTRSNARGLTLLGWSDDSKYVYFSQPLLGEKAEYFACNPAIFRVDLATGKEQALGSSDNIFDAAFSPDGKWLSEVEIAGNDHNTLLTLALHSLESGATRRIKSLQYARLAGNFSFSPDGRSLAWQEWIKKDEDNRMVVRVLNLKEDDAPLDIYEEPAVPGSREKIIRGWLTSSQLVLVHQSPDVQAGSYVVSLEDEPQITPLSPFEYLGD